MKIRDIKATEPVSAMAEAANALALHFTPEERSTFLQHAADFFGSLQRMRTPEQVQQHRAQVDAMARDVVCMQTELDDARAAMRATLKWISEGTEVPAAPPIIKALQRCTP